MNAAPRAFLIALVASMALAGCGGRPGKTLTLVVISPHRDEIRFEVEKGFADWVRRHRPQWAEYEIVIEWRDIGGGTSAIIRYLKDQYERNPETVGIDILYGGGTDPYFDLKGHKRKDGSPFPLLEKYPIPPHLEKLIPLDIIGVPLRDPDGYWHGTTMTSLGIFYNRAVLDRLGLEGWEPKSWRDLGDERLTGWVSAGDPRMSGSVHMLYEWLLQLYGWEEGYRQLMRLAANARGFARFSDAVSRDVVFGEAAAGGTLDSYAFSALTRDLADVRAGLAPRPTLGLTMPKGELILNPDSIAILRGAPHRELAQAFVEYNLSEEGGQQLWMLQPTSDAEARERHPGRPHRYNICRLGLMEHMYEDTARYPPAIWSVQINPYREARGGPQEAKRYDNKKADSRRRALDDLFGAWAIDTHAELSAAWRAALRSRQRGRLEKELFAPPMSEQELIDLRGPLGDPRKRAEIVSNWLDQARERYRRIRNVA
jgi:ABC-type Fe3+ transport system substrate-binding protein